MLKVAEVAEVDVHSLLFVLGHLLGILCIVFEWLVVISIREVLLQELVVFIVWLQHETERVKKLEISDQFGMRMENIEELT
jgi:hypothetical protein